MAKTHWLYPANTKFYDVLGAMAEKDTYWPIHTQVSPGDKVFIYLAAPYKQIGFVCNVLEIGLSGKATMQHAAPFLKGKPKPEKQGKAFMKLRPVISVPIDPDSVLGFAHLKRHGLAGMLMGPRRLENNPELLKYILENLP